MSGYYDIDDFLPGSELVQCKMLTEGKMISFIDSTTHRSDRDLKKGHKLDLPLYLATQLQRMRAVEIKPPKEYCTQMRHKLKGDPKVVNLKKKS